MRRGKEIASLLPSSFLPSSCGNWSQFPLPPSFLPSFRMTTGGGRLSVRPSSELQKFQTSIFVLFLQGQSEDLTEFFEPPYACNSNSWSCCSLLSRIDYALNTL